MKQCLICGAQCVDSEHTCPKCGEASWAEIAHDELPASGKKAKVK